MVLAIKRHEDTIKRRWDYVVEIRPRLYVLVLCRTIKLYPNFSINDILLDLLAQGRLALGAEVLPYENLVSDALFTTPFKRLEISYAEHNLAYLQALIQYGIRFCFEETTSGEKVIFVDAPYKLPRHVAMLNFNPDKKDDVNDDKPGIYQTIQKCKWLPAQGRAAFYDPKAVTESLHDEHGYELYSYYSGLRAGQQVSIEGIDGFIERVKLTGIFEHEAWRFDSQALFRNTNDASNLGALIERMKLPATLSGVEIQPDHQVNDLGEFKVKFPERFMTDTTHDPWVSFRDLQNTSTSEGGASHSMSGAAEVLLASQNGAAYDWIILGSLDNNERPSLVTSENYRESRMHTTGGVNMHLRRQDATNPYSEINMSLHDSQSNPSGINLGTNMPSMQNDSDSHGIQEISSGYGKRAIMGNFYDTVGKPENPVHQVSLTQDSESGMIAFNQQTNVSQGGAYNKNYYTNAIAASQQTTNVQHNFYVVEQKQNLFEIANNLYGNEPKQDKLNFIYLNNAILNATTVIKSGTWLYIPQTQKKYDGATSLAVAQTLQAVNNHEKINDMDLTNYSLWHQVFSWDWDNNLLAFAGSYFSTSAQQSKDSLQAIGATLIKSAKLTKKPKPR
jgi:hypothetical protein